MTGGSASDHKEQVWLVTDSLPYGGDVDQTVPMQLGDDIPSGVGVLLAKEQELHDVAAAASASNDPPSNDPSASHPEARNCSNAFFVFSTSRGFTGATQLQASNLNLKLPVEIVCA